MSFLQRNSISIGGLTLAVLCTSAGYQTGRQVERTTARCEVLLTTTLSNPRMVYIWMRDAATRKIDSDLSTKGSIEKNSRLTTFVSMIDQLLKGAANAPVPSDTELSSYYSQVSFLFRQLVDAGYISRAECAKIL